MIAIYDYHNLFIQLSFDFTVEQAKTYKRVNSTESRKRENCACSNGVLEQITSN